MKRTKQQRKVSAILTGDWHLREDAPICRTDDFLEAQTSKLKQIKRLQEEHKCPVMIAGDVFHHWKTSPFLLAWAIRNLPNETNHKWSNYKESGYLLIIPGQHDLPQHNIELFDKSGLAVLENANRAHILYKDKNKIYLSGTPNNIKILGFPYGSILKEEEKKNHSVSARLNRNIALCHILVWKDKPIIPGEEKRTAEKLLDRLTDFDLIVVGDNHSAFTVKKDERLLVNPGCLTRQMADQADYQPRVYLWYAETNEVKPHYFNVEHSVVSREHLKHKEERDERMQAFASSLNKEWQTEHSFEENLRQFETKNKVRKSVMDVIWRAVENVHS